MDTDDHHATLAVLAHDLLNQMATVQSALRTLDDRWEQLTTRQQRDLARLAEDRANALEAALKHLVRTGTAATSEPAR